MSMSDLPSFLRARPPVGHAPPPAVAASAGPPGAHPAALCLELRAFRWQDLGALMDIERAGFRVPVSEPQMRQFLERPSVVATVAERDGDVLGFSVHEYGHATIRLVNVAVWPPAWRTGIGRRLVGRVGRGLGAGRWRRIDARVPEYAVVPLMFLKAEGFRAVPDARGKFTGPHGTICMRFEPAWAAGGGLDTGCGPGGAGGLP